jgi:hypothetical protein
LTTAKDVECFFLTNLIAYKGLSQLYSTIPEMEKQILSTFNELQATMKQRQAESGTSFGTKFRIGIYQLQLRWAKKELLKYFSMSHSKD